MVPKDKVMGLFYIVWLAFSERSIDGPTEQLGGNLRNHPQMDQRIYAAPSVQSCDPAIRNDIFSASPQLDDENRGADTAIAFCHRRSKAQDCTRCDDTLMMLTVIIDIPGRVQLLADQNLFENIELVPRMEESSDVGRH